MTIEELIQRYGTYRMPLKELVFQVLRDGILQGEFHSGERLMEIPLAKRLGVSRTPVREAFHELEREGLVISYPGKGVCVAGFTEKEISDVLEVRRVLEELAVRLAIPRITMEEIRKLGEYDELFRKATEQGEINDCAMIDEEFHYIIIRAAQNKELLRLITDCREKIYRFRAAYLADPVHYPRLVEEHHKIYELIRNERIEEAAQTMYDHIDRQQQTMLELLRNGKVK